MTKQYIFGLLLIALGVSTSAFSQTVTPPISDNQSWNEVQLTVPLTKKLSGIFNGVFRVGRNFRRPVDERAGFQFSYKATKNFTLASGFVYRTAQPFGNRKSSETRILGSLTVNLPIKKVNLSNRSQYEYHFNNSRSDVWWYRNRSQIEREITIGKTKIKPFISAEFFYNGTQRDWFRAHYTAGVGKKFNNHFTLDIYYLRRQDGISRPGNINAIGTTWKIHF